TIRQKYAALDLPEYELRAGQARRISSARSTTRSARNTPRLTCPQLVFGQVKRGVFLADRVVERADVVNFRRAGLSAGKILRAIFGCAAGRCGIVEVIHIRRSHQVEVSDTIAIDLLSRTVHA